MSAGHHAAREPAGGARRHRRRAHLPPRGGAQVMGPRGQELVELLAHPAAVAIVGASSNPHSPSGRPVDYLTRFGFAGSVLPVNPRGGQIGGLRAIPDLSEAPPGTVDVALIAVPAPAVVPALADAAHAGAQVAIIIGSGFEDRDSPERRALDAFTTDS